MRAVIGALRVDLGLNSAQFSKGVKQAEDRLDKFGRSVASGLKVGAVAATAAFAGISLAIRGVINDADDLAKTSRAIGIPVDELARLRFAADLSGTAFDSFKTSLRKFSQSISESIEGTGAGADAFATLGISVQNQNGTLKTSSQLISEVSDRFAVLPNSAQKTALALDLFGRTGAQMINLLNGGSEALQALKDEADDLGIVFDQNTVEAAERFNDNLTRLKQVSAGLTTRITAALVPALDDLLDGLVDFVRDGVDVQKVAEFIADGFRFLAGQTVRFARFVAALRVELSGYGDVAKKVFSGDFSGARGAFSTISGDIQAVRDQYQKWIDQVESPPNIKPLSLSANDNNGSGNNSGTGLALITPRRAGGSGSASRSAGSSAREERDAAKELIGDLNREISLIGKSNREIEISNNLRRAGADATIEQRSSIIDLTGTIFDQNKALEDQAAASDGLKSSFSDITNSLTGLISGTSDWRDVLTSVVGQLGNIIQSSNKLQQSGGSLGGLFGGESGSGGGLFSTLLGGIGGLLSFEGGGSTPSGPRSGGVDGRGGFLSILHPNEEVIDNRVRSAGNSNGAIVIQQGNIVVEGSADDRAIQQIRQEMNGGLQDLRAEVPSLVNKARMRGML